MKVNSQEDQKFRSLNFSDVMWKPAILWKKYDFTKGVPSYVSNFGFNRSSSQKVKFNEKPHIL